MVRPRRQTPSGQMSLFAPAKDAVRQNDRWIATATATVQNLLTSTTRSPEEDYGLQTDTQRPLHKPHCLALANYYLKTPNWIIAPFVFTSQSQDFTIEDRRFQSLEGEFQIIDGQHRIQALHIAHDQLKDSSDPSDKQLLDNILQSEVSLQFIENRGPTDAAQLFVDLNKGKTISQSELASLDGRDPVINAIKEALENVPWADERTERTRKNPSPNGSDVFSLTSLRTVVKAVEVGVRPALPRARRDHMSTPQGKQEAQENLTNFLEWLPLARPEYQNLKDQPQLYVPDERTRHYAYDERFITLIADAWGNSSRSGPPIDDLAAAVQKLNLSRSDPANDLSRPFNLIEENGRMKAYTKADYTGASVGMREAAQNL